MKQELYEQLQRFDKEFQWALQQNFLNLGRGDFYIIVEAYKQLTGEEVQPSRLTCGTCRLRIMKTVAGYYNQHKLNEQLKEIKDREEQEKREAQQEETPETPKETKKKPGRPKKIDLDKEEDK